MVKELAYYEVLPKIFLSGKKTQVTIRPLGMHAMFKPDTEYLVTFLPMCESNEALGTEYESIVLKSTDGSLYFEHAFPNEQAHILRVFKRPLKESEKPIGNFMVYSLEEDIYKLRPYRGDFHVHSFHSDGRESPAVVAANFRRSGYDFLAITDHYTWKPSKEAIEAYEFVPIDLKLFYGEEVHPHKNPVHIVNFGGTHSVNEIFQGNSVRYYCEVEEIMRSNEVPDGVDAFQYASCVWSFERIREAGGIGILCHPYWISNVYNVSEKLLKFLFEKNHLMFLSF